MNEDWIAPGRGFGEHPHSDMEIVTYVLEGELEHRDSMGNGEILRPGEFQRMTAGTGITHSEFNPSPTEAVHLYQIWIFPSTKRLEPSYEQRPFPESERQGKWQLVAAPDGEHGALTIHQDARIYLANLSTNSSLDRQLAANRHAWLQVLRGDLELDDQYLSAGDGVAISDEVELRIHTKLGAELMLFDLS